jgi:hypothetical protein
MAFDKDKTQPFTFIAVLETAVQNLRTASGNGF